MKVAYGLLDDLPLPERRSPSGTASDWSGVASASAVATFLLVRAFRRDDSA
jgi:hypothetical protein